jgi:hypothetical protein
MQGASHTQGHQPTRTEGLFSVVCARILATSGGKVVRVDRFESLNIPDAMTRAAALSNGEADRW